ncbi:MAG: TetR family transcriptional regulator [Hyphomonadaceae bacterium]|nr:TetR family transcriptional regulator [Hyphomonadaceae bacterium]
MTHDASADLVGEVREKGNLDRATIVHAALRLLDEVGIDGLSTRRLAAELGIKSASLYWHFKDKGELLNEMSSEMFNECLQAIHASKSDADMLEHLAEIARILRRTALSRRDGAQVMARPLTRTLSAKTAFEENVKALVRAGLADMDARLALQTIRRFAIGTAIQERSNDALSLSAGIVCTGDEGFEFGLQAFIQGLKVRIAARLTGAPH